MLSSGLEESVANLLLGKDRFVDLFTGSGVVATRIAEQYPVTVMACDLQNYACDLAAAVIARTSAVKAAEVREIWFVSATKSALANPLFARAAEFQRLDWQAKPEVSIQIARDLCANAEEGSLIHAYGGHYFSPLQALTIQALREALPADRNWRAVAMASLLMAASHCVAAPGHTAQPFGTTERGRQFLFHHWKRNPIIPTALSVLSVASRFAIRQGSVRLGDASEIAGTLGERDVAFLDPPYSNVQYSRFYHVLESISQGKVGCVSGVGRYPDPEHRPRSRFSLKSESEEALSDLLKTLSEGNVNCVLTFPRDAASNGLSGEKVKEICGSYYSLSSYEVNGRHSTLGGNLDGRGARVPAYELVITLQTKDSIKSVRRSTTSSARSRQPRSVGSACGGLCEGWRSGLGDR